MKSPLASRSVVSWAMYDFANSAFATSVLSVIFSVYFASVLVPPEGVRIVGMTIPGESLWGYIVSLVMLCVLLVAPALGSLADKKDRKHLFLSICIVVGGIATCALVEAVPGRLAYACTFIFIGLFAYELSLVFYNAFINEIVDESRRGAVSGWGFAVGYIGGGLCLAVNMMMISRPAMFGLSSDDATWPVRASVFLVGVWWVVFSLPAMMWLRDKPSLVPASSDDKIRSFRQLRKTVKDVAQRKDLRQFLLSFLIYDDGIQTILLMASIFGAKELGFSTSQLAMVFLLVQFVAFVGALLWGRVADVWNHKAVIVATIAIFAAIILWAVFMQNQWEFWLLAVAVGIVMGGAQAASRSLFSLLIPPARAGEFFSLFSIVGKAASLIGPFVFGVVSQFYGIRAGVGSLLIFFVVGGLFLWSVDEKRGRADAMKMG